MLECERVCLDGDDADRVGDRVESSHHRQLEEGGGADRGEMRGEERVHRGELER